MKLNKQTGMWLLGACAAALLPCTSQAGLSQFDVSSYNSYGMTVIANGVSHSTHATALVADRIGGDTLPAPTTDPFVTFCLDINEGLADGWWKSGAFSDVSLTGNGGTRLTDGLFRAASLYRQYSSGILSVAGNGSGYTWQDTQKGAALQLAIWEVLYQPYNASDSTGHGGYDVNSGGSYGFQVANGSKDSSNQAVRDLANQYLWSSYNRVDPSLTTTFWNAVNANGTTRCSQDLIGPAAAVPEPTTMIAGALLLVPFGVSTLRGLRKNRA